ncbi:MAG: protoporphyrinogen oxidase HemJ [Alphaproteobacteria bacterium]|nr:protoporphyrinogen oxidase HemJ [Alphaproteobacteria bacterium]
MLEPFYNWIKTFHIIAVMSWMAGMLYLPRLFVYHAAATEQPVKDTLAIMELRLLRYIMNPAMILSWLLGLLMIAINPSLFDYGWMHVKFTAVILMSVIHHVYGRWRKKLAADTNTHSPKFYKWWNEAPTVLMIIIVIMAVAEPF